jgi:deazaflavin-dependent oxidoreductase (nitroreductase family)
MAPRLRYVDPLRRRGRATRTFAWFSATRIGRWLSRHVVWKVDPHLLRVTGGRFGMTLMIRSALLETRGARTGLPRSNGVIYFHDGDRVVIAASQAGAPTHPGWFHNLVAHPDVTLGGLPMRASVVTDDAERARLWALADNVFPPFARYRRDAAEVGRTIPIVRLATRDS